MRTMLAALALAGVAWGCDVKAATEAAPQDTKTYTATVKIDDV